MSTQLSNRGAASVHARPQKKPVGSGEAGTTTTPEQTPVPTTNTNTTESATANVSTSAPSVLLSTNNTETLLSPITNSNSDTNGHTSDAPNAGEPPRIYAAPPKGGVSRLKTSFEPSGSH